VGDTGVVLDLEQGSVHAPRLRERHRWIEPVAGPLRRHAAWSGPA
jgi:hypothetical protein